MPFRAVALPPSIAGRLWLASMPGRFEAWPAFLAEASRLQVAEVVCLTPRDEIARLSPRYHSAVVTGDVPFRWRHVPMPNFGGPADREAFRSDVQAIAAAVASGESVLLHCAAGLGRTGTVAACVAKALGIDGQRAAALVQQAGSNPQNAAQSGIVDWF